MEPCAVNIQLYSYLCACALLDSYKAFDNENASLCNVNIPNGTKPKLLFIKCISVYRSNNANFCFISYVRHSSFCSFFFIWDFYSIL